VADSDSGNEPKGVRELLRVLRRRFYRWFYNWSDDNPDLWGIIQVVLIVAAVIGLFALIGYICQNGDCYGGP
jgi:hypothetical protein